MYFYIQKNILLVNLMKKIIVINRKGGCGKTTVTLSLTDVLEDARVVDLDNQQTLTISSELTGRHVPVKIGFTDCKYLIIDTPPYEDLSVRSILSTADLIVIPALIGYPDLLGTQKLADYIIENKLQNKTFVVFNKVRKPYNRSYHEVKGFWKQNYPKLKVAKQELSQLRGYQDVLAKPINGKALEEIKSLIKEMKI